MPSSRPVPLRLVSSQYKGEIVDGAPEPYSADNPNSRAVARYILSGTSEVCKHCDETITYIPTKQARRFLIQVTCVDESGKWVGNDFYYPPSCYQEAGEPDGPVYTMSPQEGVMSGIIESRVESSPPGQAQ